MASGKKYIIVDEQGNEVKTTTNEKNGSVALLTDPNEHHSTFNEEYTADGSGNIAAAGIITPTSGNHLGIHGFQITSDGASGVVALDFLTSTEKVARAYLSKESALATGDDHTEGAEDEDLSLTVTGIGSGKKVFIKIFYVEHKD